MKRTVQHLNIKNIKAFFLSYIKVCVTILMDRIIKSYLKAKWR